MGSLAYTVYCYLHHDTRSAGFARELSSRTFRFRTIVLVRSVAAIPIPVTPPSTENAVRWASASELVRGAILEVIIKISNFGKICQV